MSEPLYITFLWHMHQPYYKDPLKGEYALPWTYLHCVKDYFDMGAIIDEVPGMCLVVNFVPSLLEQIEDYAAGTAVDPFLLKGKMAPVDMTEEDRLFLLDNFFSANRQRMIDPYPRYLELFRLAGDGAGGRERLRSFSEQDILDLQVWFFLAWTGEAARRRKPEFLHLIKKGKYFTEADKALLFAKQREIVQEILPLYRRLQDEGKVELSVTPYFHPILPLLCDIRSALGAMPRASLPASRIMHPEDARSQVAGGVSALTTCFGVTPAGMWPSEGSVSDEALAIIAECGLKWAATDEDVLARSLGHGLREGKAELYHPYVFRRDGRELALFFRDHQLSDLIGFTYSQWDTARAVNDFIGRLNEIRQHRDGRRVVSIILDGENAWEYYPGNAYDFLKSLYSALVAAHGLQPATFSQVLAAASPERVLGHIHPGSWINADYGVWVGHPEENLGWDYLEKARDAAVAASPEVAKLLENGNACRELAVPVDTAALVCKSLYAAEGSDWFWWYGDDHFSPHSDRFDRLFRKHLMNVYRLLNLDVPQELFEPIKVQSPAGLVREQVSFISPVISGEVNDYFEWLGAGLFNLTKQSSAMHAAESLFQLLYYGYNLEAFFFRLDADGVLRRQLREGDVVVLHVVNDREYQLAMPVSAESGEIQVKEQGSWKETGFRATWCIDRIGEVRVPLAAINLQQDSTIAVFVTLQRCGEEIGRWPADGSLQLHYVGAGLEVDNWFI